MRELFVNHYNARSVRPVLFAEVASVRHRNAHGWEIPWPANPIDRADAFPGFVRWPSFDGQAAIPQVATQRKMVHGAGRSDSRERADFLQQLLIKCLPFRAQELGFSMERNDKRQRLIGFETGIKRLEPCETMEHQAGADEHDQRQRDLCHHEDTPQFASGASFRCSSSALFQTAL